MHLFYVWSSWLRCVCWAVVTFASVLLAGTAPAAGLGTPTGKPEVTIQGATKPAIFDRIADQMLSSDFLLKQRTENVAVFAKTRSSLVNRPTEYRVTFNLIDTAGGVRVMASMIQYANPNTMAERLDVDFSRHPKSAPGIQAILDYVKVNLERAARSAAATATSPRAQALSELETTVSPRAPCAIPIVGLEIAGTQITEVTPGGPAQRAGVRPGDILLAIDGEPATTSVQNGSRLNGKADTSVLLRIQRGAEELKIPVMREKPSAVAEPKAKTG